MRIKKGVSKKLSKKGVLKKVACKKFKSVPKKV